jgi:hypothetical protein
MVGLPFPISGVSVRLYRGSTPTPSLVIPDWRRLQRVHPNPSQIGVDFSDHPRFGVGLTPFNLGQITRFLAISAISRYTLPLN